MPAFHVVHLVSNPYTHDGRVRNETQALAQAGHEVTVIAWDRAGTHPEEETIGAVRVLRRRNTPWMRRLGRDILRLRPWWRLARSTLDRLHAERPVALVHAHDLDTLPAAVRFCEKKGLPLVFDAHEVWGDMIARDLPPPVPAWFHRLERRLLPHVDALVTVNEPLERHYAALGVRDITRVMNAKEVPEGDYRPPPEGGFRLVYHGTLGPARYLVEAVAALRDLDGVSLEIAGQGKPEYVRRLEAACTKAPNVRYLGLLPPDEVLPRTIDAHAVLCLTDPQDRNNRRATANKQFEAMAAGRPIIVSAGTYLAEFTERLQIGLAVRHDPQSLQDAVVRLQNDPELAGSMGRRALRLAQDEYNWEVQAGRLRALYERLLERSAEASA